MSNSEQCSNRLELELISLLVNSIMLIEANSDTSSVGPSNKDESALIKQVVLKIYVYYNDKLFGIFHSGFIRTKSSSCLEHCTLIVYSITCIMLTPSQQSV